MAKKQKYYVVWQGKKTGIFTSWEDCKAQITGYQGAQYKSFSSFTEAQKAFNKAYDEVKAKAHNKNEPSLEQLERRVKEVDFNALAVDAASSGNPGKVEYRGVWIKNNKQIFHKGPFEEGTNNIGEFLALVHALALLKKNQYTHAVYSDSKIAIGWVYKKKCNTKLKRNPKNAAIFELVDRAEKWLATNYFTTKIIKWDTKNWGEIPADFGRK
ncbi:viroplasmin family protein [Mesonia sp. HuA40]|uniref:ribonuclease H1 domain-containing protein n=1 Tax=Mesonia sp. HuA40 TaxID=2602761 RepID=UPI0011C728E4|nr:ribonuclease H family protein [Mesonia sp. HuA40]TXK72632.1 ribonuclease H [Mesonia sp. HuA40]